MHFNSWENKMRRRENEKMLSDIWNFQIQQLNSNHIYINGIQMSMQAKYFALPFGELRI